MWNPLILKIHEASGIGAMGPTSVTIPKKSIFSIHLVQWLLNLPGRASYGDSSRLTATSVTYLCLRRVCLKSLILKIQLLSGTLQVTRTGSFPSLPPPRFTLCQFSALYSLSPSSTPAAFPSHWRSQTHLCLLQLGVPSLSCCFLSLCCSGCDLPAVCAISTSLLSLLFFVLPAQPRARSLSFIGPKVTATDGSVLRDFLLVTCSGSLNSLLIQPGSPFLE